MGFPGGSDPLEEDMANHSNYSCLENPMVRGTWQATDHKVAKSRTQLKQLSTMHAHMTLNEEKQVVSKLQKLTFRTKFVGELPQVI